MMSSRFGLHIGQPWGGRGPTGGGVCGVQFVPTDTRLAVLVSGVELVGHIDVSERDCDVPERGPAGLNRVSVARFETSPDANPTLDLVHKLCVALGCGIQELAPPPQPPAG